MNQLLAKIKNRKQKNEGYRKIIDNKNCYSFPDNIQVVEYNPNTLLEEGQWYYISEFSQQDYCIDLLKQVSFDSVDFSTLERDNFKKIDFLCSFQDDNFYYFQKVRSSQLTIKKRLNLGSPYKLDEESVSIVINPYADAIYKKDTDTLYFQRLETISSIFKGIEMLYREATEEETAAFFNNDFISLQPTLEIAKIGKASRKRIAMAMTILNKFSEQERQEIIEYTKINSGLEFENNSFTINTEEDVKKLILGIQERYYETPISKEKRIANSIINVENGTIESDDI